MARSWSKAQENEKKFWDEIYVKEVSDISSYKKVTFEVGIAFLLKTIMRHNLNLNRMSDSTVADIGCGPYGLVYGLSHFSNLGYLKGCNIMGIDPLMDLYRSYRIFPECPNTKLITSKGESTGIENNSVDFVFSSNVIDHVENPSEVISEVRRILKKDGIFCVSSHVLYPIFNPVAPIFKYIDKNHPHHFTQSKLVNLLKKQFNHVELTYSATMIEDHPDFAFRKLKKSPSLIRGLKRVSSNYIIKNIYINCR